MAGVASLQKVMSDLPAAMEQCKAMESDIKAIIEVVKGFHGIEDLLHHIKSDLAADSKGQIAAEFELMVRSFETKQYDDFGRHLGQMLHRLVVGPEGAVVGFPWRASCTGAKDPSGSYPMCYEGSAGALGVKVKLVSYASGKGTMDLVGSGIESISCKGKSFTKSGQDISPAISDCLPKVITVQKVEYCSDSDAVQVTVKDTHVPIPVAATLKKVACTDT